MSGHQKSRVADEDDDLDDIDDVLDQFEPRDKPISPPPPPASARASTSSQAAAGAEEALMNRLAEEMESLFEGLGVESRTNSEDPDAVAERERLAAAWEAMLVEGMDAMSAMNKRKESESGLKSSDSTASAGEATFQSLLSQLEGLSGLSGDGGGDDEHLGRVLETMMGQLMSKDVLYEPLKELYDKFPGYLAENGSTISSEDKKRFEAQIPCIRRLLDELEAETYRDDDEKTRARIVELMGELQTHGSPPGEIMGPLPPGFNMGTDGLPEIPGQCDVH